MHFAKFYGFLILLLYSIIDLWWGHKITTTIFSKDWKGDKKGQSEGSEKSLFYILSYKKTRCRKEIRV